MKVEENQTFQIIENELEEFSVYSVLTLTRHVGQRLC